MKRIVLFFSFFVFHFSLALLMSAAEQDYYRNPVIPGDVADPTVIRWGDTYYAAGTSSEWAPHYPLFRSSDLVNWEQVGHIFQQLPSWASSSFWAPELFVYRGKVYCYYTARSKTTSRSYVGVAVADTPEGEYVDYGPLVDFGTEDIDAFVYNDNGKLYITWKAYGLDPRPIEILCQPLSDDGLHLEGEAVTLLVDKENIGNEGQCIFRKGDWYYLLYSARGCCGPRSDYEVRVARSHKLFSAFQPYDDNPILMGSADVLSIGHGTLVDTPDGRLFYLCHAYLRGAGFYLGRQPFLQELFVGSDEWPHFKTGRLACLRQPMPFSGVEQKAVSDFNDDFLGETLKKEWTWNYTYCDVSAQVRGGSLLLSGIGRGRTPGRGAALCLRPAQMDYDFSTVLSSKTKELSGLTYYGNDDTHIVFGRRGDRIQLVRRLSGEETVLFDERCRSRSVFLKGSVRDGSKLSFAFSTDGKKWVVVGTDALDGSDVIAWDRISRPGVYTEVSDAARPARFDSFAMQYIKDAWAMTGFQRVKGVGPIVSPDPNQQFLCPVRKEMVRWESDDTFNPAAAVIDGRVALLYRAEDHSGGGIGTRTSRLGLALSADGIHFKKNSTPCFYPDVDSQYDAEWPGGCEDPRVVRTEDGLYVMLYTQWNRRVPRLAVATTRDFRTWEKHGLAFGKCHGGRFSETFSKSASIVTRLTDDGLVVARVNGKYMMYWGEQFINLALSDNLTDWEPLLDENGDFLKLVLPRKGYFDSSLTECGPPALLTDKGILLMYNGRNATDDTCDARYARGSYCAGQVLFSQAEPTKVLHRLDEPFFVPEADFEKSGQYPMGTVFIEGLVYHRHQWFLYYGCADSRVGVAVMK
jgi:Beta-xylosidase